LDMFTLLIGAIALGLAVDDTVHFMHNFRRYELQYNDVDKAVRLTLLGTGRAITLTSIVLALGFLVLTFSQMNNMFDFGVLTASAILVALLADFFSNASNYENHYQGQNEYLKATKKDATERPLI
jgi:predicted RND superfamily exporter protein